MPRWRVRLLHDAELRGQVHRAAVRLVPAACAPLWSVWAGYGSPSGRSENCSRGDPDIHSWIQRHLAQMNPRTRCRPPLFYRHRRSPEVRPARLPHLPVRRAPALPTVVVLPVRDRAEDDDRCTRSVVTGIWFALRDREFDGPSRVECRGIAMVIVAMPSALDLGVRYLLPFYVPFAIAAACTIAAMLARRTRLQSWRSHARCARRCIRVRASGLLPVLHASPAPIRRATSWQQH